MSDLNFFKENLFTSIQNPVVNDGDVDVTHHFRDIHFLITQKELDALDASSLSKFLEPLNKAPADDLHLSDDDLFKVVQSRYVQQPSDVKEFADFLIRTADDIKQKYSDYELRQKNWSNFISSLERKKSDDSNSSPTSPTLPNS